MVALGFESPGTMQRPISVGSGGRSFVSLVSRGLVVARTQVGHRASSGAMGQGLKPRVLCVRTLMSWELGKVVVSR